MRIFVSVVFALLVIAMVVCSIIAFKSRKPIGKSVSFLCIALIPPIIGNLLIIASPMETLPLVGCYIYFVGMDLVIYAALKFALKYCDIKLGKKFLFIEIIIIAILVGDAIQLLLNPVFHHSFSLVLNEYHEGYVEGQFWSIVAYTGQTIHRIVDYTILAGVIGVFVVKTITAPRVYSEKYWIILAVMLAVTAWESFYIFSRTPVDRSMIGFGVFGLLIFFFSLYYRPLRLLDRMLATIASKMPEALFFYDTNGRCIWVNNQARNLVKVEDNELDDVNARLTKLFGKYEKDGNEWMTTFMSGTDEEVESYYELEKHAVTDDRGRVVGSFLSVRDSTVEQKTIQRETYKATHDRLTKVYNRAGYNSLLSSLDMKNTFFLMVDADSFKEINDTYGHEIGDRVLINIVNTVKKHFREDDHMCRIGGDEFVIFVQHADANTAKIIEERIEKINEELAHPEEKLPVISISAGGAYGRYARDEFDLFETADQALYETKRNGKKGFTLFDQNSKKATD